MRISDWSSDVCSSDLLAEFFQSCFFKRTAGFFGNDRAARQNGDVFQHGFAAVAETRRLDSRCLQDAADVVHNQRGQGFAFDVFGNDQQRTARSEEHTSELQSLMRISYAVFCLKKKRTRKQKKQKRRY